MISTFLAGDITKAGEMVFENNPLSMLCSLICNHENQCQGHCVLNRKGAPVHISSIENYISENYFAKTKLAQKQKNGIKAAVIGSGPAGLTISILLALKGYDITIFESKDKIGGVLRYGIPEFRLPKNLLDKYQDQLINLGIRIRPNTAIGKSIGIDEMFRDGYKAISIGTGVWWPNTLHIKGETLGHVHYAIHYLTNPDAYRLGESVIIIGAGNAAMDVARTVIRHGSRNVTVYSVNNTYAASRVEAEMAMIDGVIFQYNKAPVEICDEGVYFVDTVCDDEGRVIEKTGEPVLHKADSVMISISQGPSSLIPNQTKGLTTTRNGLVVADPRGITERPGIFASGDVVKGAKTVVEAVAYSKRVAEAMDEYMSSL